MTTHPARRLSESSLQRFLCSKEALQPDLPTVEDAYRMGRACHLNGPNEHNGYFRLLATPEHTCVGEKGKADAAAGK